MAIKPNFSVVAQSTILGFGAVSIVADLNAERTVQHINMDDVIVPAKGKTPAGVYTASVAETRKLTDFIPAVKDSMVVGTMKRNATLAAHLLGQPQADEAAQVAFIVAACEELNTFLEANKPVAASPVRDIEAYTQKLLADLFLVMAGLTGNIPTAEELEEALSFAKLDAAREAAKVKAEKHGVDTHGQFRLQAARVTKDEDAA